MSAAQEARGLKFGTEELQPVPQLSARNDASLTRDPRKKPGPQGSNPKSQQTASRASNPFDTVHQDHRYDGTVPASENREQENRREPARDWRGPLLSVEGRRAVDVLAALSRHLNKALLKRISARCEARWTGHLRLGTPAQDHPGITAPEASDRLLSVRNHNPLCPYSYPANCLEGSGEPAPLKLISYPLCW